MVVGLSMLTFGSAATAGVDGAAPIFEVLNEDGCDTGGDLDVGGSSGDCCIPILSYPVVTVYL